MIADGADGSDGSFFPRFFPGYSAAISSCHWRGALALLKDMQSAEVLGRGH